MQWDEPGNPCNVVQRKCVSARGNAALEEGDMYDVKLHEESKQSCYPAKLLGIGKSL